MDEETLVLRFALLIAEVRNPNQPLINESDMEMAREILIPKIKRLLKTPDPNALRLFDEGNSETVS